MPGMLPPHTGHAKYGGRGRPGRRPGGMRYAAQSLAPRPSASSEKRQGNDWRLRCPVRFSEDDVAGGSPGVAGTFRIVSPSHSSLMLSHCSLVLMISSQDLASTVTAGVHGDGCIRWAYAGYRGACGSHPSVAVVRLTRPRAVIPRSLAAPVTDRNAKAPGGLVLGRRTCRFSTGRA